MRVAVIMAGGSGERFWPLSRKLRPKQLLRLTDPDRTMLEEAVDRVAPLLGRENVYIATATHLAKPIRQAGIVVAENVLAEPDKRNTLGCLAWVAAHFLAKYAEPVTLTILTADHKIEEEDQFRDDLSLAITIAEETRGLVTIGVPPTRPETGYGYIECGENLDEKTSKVLRFQEKPSIEKAKEFVAAKSFLWNSGMFVWTLDTFCEQLAKADQQVGDLIKSMANELRLAHEAKAAEFFRELPNLSIDYALMEKADSIYCLRASFPWDDVGAFDALLRTMPTDENGNVVMGFVHSIDCQRCVLYNDSKKRVLTAIGLRDQLMIQTEDSVMTAPVSDSQRVKELVAQLKDSIFL
jgi:mannose-1-phosphate guanylyltransferase